MARQIPVVVLVLLGGLPVAWPATVRADPLAAIERARAEGCAAPHLPGLRDNAKLRQAAARMAEGSSLHAALAASDYFAAQSSAVHISGAQSDAQVARMLESNYCRPLTDPQWQDIGAVRRGRDVYFVLARGVALPSESESPRIERRILELVNAARGEPRRCGARNFQAAAPLASSFALDVAALAHSREMASTGLFEHVGSDGSSPAMRVSRAGYGGFLIVGENIAAGALTAGEVVQGWLDSPPHCENIMDPRFIQMGTGFAVNKERPQLVYWTQDFAAPRHLPAAGRSATP